MHSILILYHKSLNRVDKQQTGNHINIPAITASKVEQSNLINTIKDQKLHSPP